MFFFFVGLNEMTSFFFSGAWSVLGSQELSRLHSHGLHFHDTFCCAQRVKDKLGSLASQLTSPGDFWGACDRDIPCSFGVPNEYGALCDLAFAVFLFLLVDLVD